MSFRPLTNVKETLDRIFISHGARLQLAVETGVFKGELTSVFSEYFQSVVSIELSEFYFDEAQRSLDAENVTLYQGNSKNILPVIISGWSGEQRTDSTVFDFKLNDIFNEAFNSKLAGHPALFFLDAHFCKTTGGSRGTGPQIDKGEFVLWNELLTINTKRNHNDVVIVDDVHCFNTENYGQWQGVNEESICEALGDRVVKSEIINDIFVVYMKKRE